MIPADIEKAIENLRDLPARRHYQPAQEPLRERHRPPLKRKKAASLADRVAEHLLKHGGEISARRIADLFEVAITSVAGMLRRAVSRGDLSYRVEGQKGRVGLYKLGPKARRAW